MNNSWGWFREPTDIMEHIAEVKFYYGDDEAKEKLLLVAQHIDNPLMLKDLEEQWLYGRKNKPKEQPGYYNLLRLFGDEWDRE